jgi:hypothetical protein
MPNADLNVESRAKVQAEQMEDVQSSADFDTIGGEN